MSKISSKAPRINELDTYIVVQSDKIDLFDN